ncbi:CvpA family protein [Desulfovibrio sp. OttesenSCG-928-G15]|nr:CvpA family protein [Desulfovibrio sp. OttesenSCG-928-G15]
MTTVSVLDLGLGLFILLFLVRGLLRGMIREVSGLVGIFLGLFIAGRGYTLLEPQFAGLIHNARWSAGLSYAILFTATLIVVALAAALLKRFMTLTFTAWVDNAVGAAVGFIKGVFICAIVLALMHRFAPDSPFLKNAIIPQYIESLINFARSFFPAFIEGLQQGV